MHLTILTANVEADLGSQQKRSDSSTGRITFLAGRVNDEE
jgi:hypothetical protein